MQLPNLISVCRLATVPILLILAWHGYRRAVLTILVVSFASDVLDGYIARRLGQTSELGAKLDSLGDFAVYMTLPLAWWWLWPDIARHETPYIITVIASLTIPPLIALGKFRTLTSYHTWTVKLASLLVGGSMLLIFAGGPVWPFRVATPLSVIAALEEIAITLTLTERRSNVRSFWHIMKRE